MQAKDAGLLNCCADVLRLICSHLSIQDLIRLTSASKCLLRFRNIEERFISPLTPAASSFGLSIHECVLCCWSQDGYQEKIERIYWLPGERIVITGFAFRANYGENPKPAAWRYFEYFGTYSELVATIVGYREVSFDSNYGHRFYCNWPIARDQIVYYANVKVVRFIMDENFSLRLGVNKWPFNVGFRPTCRYKNDLNCNTSGAIVLPQLARLSIASLRLFAFQLRKVFK